MNAKILLGLLAILPLVLGGCTNKCNQPVGKTDLTALEGNKVNNLNGRNNIYFQFGKSNLTKDAKEIAKYQASQIGSNDHVTVEGRTDSRGTSEYNMALGAKRAESVKQELVRNGVNGDNVSTISYGKDSPIGNRADYKSEREYHAINRVATTIVDNRG